MLNLKWKSSSNRSKSQEKDAKYISAAIIPSAAFVINPTTSSEFPNLDESQNNLLTSTLNSSLLGLSQESIDKNEIPKENKKKSSKLSMRKTSIMKSQEDLQTNLKNSQSIRSRKKTKDKSLKKPPIQTNNNKESKRHIEIANGLYNEVKQTASNVTHSKETSSDEGDPVYSIVKPNHEIIVSKEYERGLSSHEIDEIPKVISDSEISSENDNNVESFFQPSVNGYQHEASNKNRVDDIQIDEIGNSIYGKPSISDLEQIPVSNEEIYNVNKSSLQPKSVSIGFEYVTKETNNSYPSKKYESHIQQNSGQSNGYANCQVNMDPEASMEKEESLKKRHNTKSNKPDINHNHMKQPSNNIQNHYIPSYNTVDFSTSEKVNFINDESRSSIKQTKAEIHLLQDTIYRLNMELSSQIPSDEPGRPIGKTIFPGKGPVPNWLMNTKYLAPLFVFHDKKYQQQSYQIQKIKHEVENFEKEILQVIKENERLHIKLQENQKGGPLSNQADLQVIVQQAKLVIEENHLLLEELNLQQQKLAICENNNLLEVAKLQKSLLSVSSERDALNDEIQLLTRRLAGVKGSTVQLSTLNQENGDNHLESSYERIYPSQLKFQETLIEELKNDKRRQELEIENLKQTGIKQEKKIQKYRKVIESDQKFRDYFNGVLEKSETVVNERNSLLDKYTLINKEISRIIGKVTAEINYRTDLDVNEHEAKVPYKDQSDEFLDKLHFIESQMDLILRNIEDLNAKCKSQEEGINNYKLQLKEKDIYIKECQNENDEMEEKLGYLLRNAENDNL